VREGVVDVERAGAGKLEDAVDGVGQRILTEIV